MNAVSEDPDIYVSGSLPGIATEFTERNERTQSVTEVPHDRGSRRHFCEARLQGAHCRVTNRKQQQYRLYRLSVWIENSHRGHREEMRTQRAIGGGNTPFPPLQSHYLALCPLNAL